MTVLCAIVVALGVGGVAGCGGSGVDDSKSSAGKGGDDVARMTSALKTLKGYESVHMDGHYMSVGQVDLQADRDGNCVGTVHYVGQGVAEIIYSAGERSWYRYDDATLAHWRRIAEQIDPEAVALHDKAAKKALGKYVESARATPPLASQTVTTAEVTGLFPEIPEHMQSQ